VLHHLIHQLHLKFQEILLHLLLHLNKLLDFLKLNLLILILLLLLK
jgi:hypothetical protein